MKKVLLAIWILYLAHNSAFAAETRSLSAEYDRSIDWYGVQLAIDGSGYRISIYMNNVLIEHVFMDNDKRSEGVYQLQNFDAPNRKIAPDKYKSVFSLNRGSNLIKIEYTLVSEPSDSSFVVKLNAGKMFNESLWKLTDIENPPGKSEGSIEFEFHLPGDLVGDNLLLR